MRKEESPLYPALEPYRSGLLDVGGGHFLYWEECGNPQGKPALFLHGGPGSGCSEGQRRFFNPHKYRIVLFDQRNCAHIRDDHAPFRDRLALPQ